MPKMQPLYKWIGDPIQLINASSLSSDGTAVATDAVGVPIAGADGVLFILAYGATDANAAHTIQIQYSSTGAASDAVTSNAGMSCTDAVFTTAIHVSGGITMMEFDLNAKGLSDRAGKLYPVIAAAETGNARSALIAIPYGGHMHLPSTNANTVIIANDT